MTLWKPDRNPQTCSCEICRWMGGGVEWGSNRKIGFALYRTSLLTRVGWIHFSCSDFTFHIKQAACGVFCIIQTLNSCLQSCIFIQASKAFLDIASPSFVRELKPETDRYYFTLYRFCCIPAIIWKVLITWAIIIISHIINRTYTLMSRQFKR
jgi:hypothetical protein